MPQGRRPLSANDSAEKAFVSPIAARALLFESRLVLGIFLRMGNVHCILARNDKELINSRL
jgi:hypothetical protein